ncbi:hypothetical protein F3B42_08810 [Bacteroides ovatus]|mgnify:CR=1 FL=1|uniref:Uncharacterized protein n=1 Tax=Bacteroides ovatus TaxID=28116 RepID=A0A7J4XZ54_BACOV|nr:hypothetical protein F3B90_10390 [Bacteroides ovatus]KAA4638139.1 hypothetical protein F3B52_13420 [Bacteroides ovatus]KAA4673386.1 hypothetical protein F3B42_08810 [Bacteroides ovatus]KAA4682303.1 hypothetical protein F3B41_10635 [Bacteroides ovatus]
MATSKCPKCDSTRFEMKEGAINGSRFRYNFVQCAACGAVIGVVPFHNTNALLEQIADKLGVRLK